MARKKAVEAVEYIPYIGELFAVVMNGRLYPVPSLDNYGPATHAFYRYGKVWYLRIIETFTDDEIYMLLEFTLAHDLPTIHLSEMR